MTTLQTQRLQQPQFFLAASGIQGVGVYTWAPWRAGDIVFPDDKATEDCVLIAEAPTEEPLKTLVNRYGVETKEGIWIPSDFNRMGAWWYMNHAGDPNLKYVGDDITAARDIAAGEELTIDYRTLDEDFSNLDF